VTRLSAEDPKNAVCEVVFFDIYQPKSACTSFSFCITAILVIDCFLSKFHIIHPEIHKYFTENIKLLRIRNKKLYRGAFEGEKSRSSLLKGADYQFLEMDY
jgi:hypothetical protein